MFEQLYTIGDILTTFYISIEPVEGIQKTGLVVSQSVQTFPSL